MEERYISDVVDLSKANKKSLNMIVSGCGSGKTYFCANTLLNYYPDVLPGEVLFVTSRSLAARQLVHDYDSSEELDTGDVMLRDAWLGYDSINYLKEKGIQVTTYDKVITMLKYTGAEALDSIKIIVLDECHALFSDTFINDVSMLNMWLFFTINRGDRYVFGLTATPGILEYSRKMWNVNMTNLCEPVYKYFAKNLWVVNLNNLPEFCNEHLTDGKTIIMCRETKNLSDLHASIPNSQMLVSKNHKCGGGATLYDPDTMKPIFEAIVNTGALPEKLDTLIATSTIREGYTLKPESNIKNVVCCFTDEMSITQLAGRCRYDIENLVIAYDGKNTKDTNDYIQEQNDMFRSFIKEGEVEWLSTLKNAVKDPYSVKKFESDTVSLLKGKGLQARKRDYNGPSKRVLNSFKAYLKEKWVVTPGMTSIQINHRKFADDSSRTDLLETAKQMGICSDTGEEINSFAILMHFIAKHYGFSIVNGREYYKKKQRRYIMIRLGGEEVPKDAGGETDN